MKSRLTKKQINENFKEAISLLGGTIKFAKKMNRTRSWVYYVLNLYKQPLQYRLYAPITEEIAYKVEKLTHGKIKAKSLNPYIE
jgi:hypothetical protein